MPPCLFSQGADMATKEQNLKRLDELALILGREPDISGSAAEIAQRVAEWEEEMQSSGDDVQVMNMDIRERENAAHDVREDTSGALTRIRVLTCLHLCGIDGETGESVEIADVGRVILICPQMQKHTLMVECCLCVIFRMPLMPPLPGWTVRLLK
ncbi:DNA packaging protein from phage origin [Escherichia coli]|uniref:DNA packaging protein from phage origin n=5 Tax=Gammaproteobacteria TaxID=1236 RepID=A0A376U0Q9_ECOLX|nr:DNA packaging protein from phage origin [Escherichia coli]